MHCPFDVRPLLALLDFALVDFLMLELPCPDSSGRGFFYPSGLLPKNLTKKTKIISVEKKILLSLSQLIFLRIKIRYIN
jgi:hypothetical protein